MQEVASSIVRAIMSLVGEDIGSALGVFVIAMIPLIELRGSIPVGYLMSLPWQTNVAVSIAGNLLPVPFILFFVIAVLDFMEKHHILPGFVGWIKKRGAKNKGKVSKTRFWGLVLFVGIPLPGTGAWTGALIASMLHIDKKEAFLAILLGVLLAAVIMTAVSYGIIAQIRF